MITQEKVALCYTRELTNNSNINNYAEMFSIQKKQPIDTGNFTAIITILETNALGVIMQTKLMLIRGDSLTAYYLNAPEVGVLIDSSDSDYFKIYAKALNLYSTIRILIDYESKPNCIIPKFSTFDTLLSSLTNLISINSKIGNNYLNSLDGETTSLNFVMQTSLIPYDYKILVNGYTGTGQSSSPNPSISVGWTITYQPIFWQGSFNKAFQYWEALSSGIYYKYIRVLNNSGVWSSFTKIN